MLRSLRLFISELTRHHWANDFHDAGYRPRRMKFPQELIGYVFKTKTSHLHRGHQLWSGMERDGLHHATLPKTYHMKMTTTTQPIPARSSPGTRTASSVASHQDGGEKYATDGPKSPRARNNITIGTWNKRSLRTAGTVEELTHEMKRYRWNILKLYEVRWKNLRETSTTEGHKLFFSCREDRHEHGVGFLIHKGIVNAIMGCRPVSRERHACSAGWLECKDRRGCKLELEGDMWPILQPVQRSHNQWGSESHNWKPRRAVWRPHHFSEKTQTGVVRAHDHLDWPRLSYRKQFKEGDEEADRGNDGTTTPKSGLTLNETSYYGKLRTARSGGSWL